MTEEKQEGLPTGSAPDTIEEIERLKGELAEAKASAERCLANWQRAEADLRNYKRLSEQEAAETRQFANATLMLKVLPVLDDLERAFKSVPAELAELPWVEGVRLIGRKLVASLEMMGLAQIKALGEAFDPKQHEAVMQSSGEDGIVVAELEKGYRLHDRVIRPAKVAVGAGEKKEAQT